MTAPPPFPAATQPASAAQSGPTVEPATQPAPKQKSSAQAAARQAQERKPKRNWFETFFDDDYLPTLPNETPEGTRKEAEFILSELQPAPQSSILDIGCGYGRHAVVMAARGFSVTGIDRSLPMLIKAAELTESSGVQVNFMHADMREMEFDQEFENIYCFNTTFGYHEDNENNEILSRIQRALKPGGRFLLSVVNRDYILDDLPLRVWWEGDGCLVMDEVEFNYFTSRIDSHRSVVFNDGRQVDRTLSIRAYSLHELGKALFDHGFRVLRVTGNLATKGRFFGQKSPLLAITCEKKGER